MPAIPTEQPTVNPALLEKQKILNRIPERLRGSLPGGEARVLDTSGTLLAKTNLTAVNVLGGGAASVVLEGARPDGNAWEPDVLKIFYPAKDEDMQMSLDAFTQEADVFDGLDHPNIAKFVGKGTIKFNSFEVPVIVRESFPKLLSDVIKEGPMPEGDVLTMVTSIALAIDHLYEKKGVIITDLSAKNVGVRSDNSVALNDLGYQAKPGVKHIDVRCDEEIGAPELQVFEKDEVKNENSKRESSVCSLSLLAWKCLTGEKVDQLNYALNPESIIHPSDKIRDKEVFAVLKKGSSLKPDDRFHTPGEFAVALSTAFESAARKVAE